MTEADEFYALRDRRTIQYGGDSAKLRLPVAIVVGTDAASSRPGQACVLALANMAARAHRRIDFVMPESSLRALGLFDSASLADEVLAIARAADPYGEFRLVSEVENPSLAIGVGRTLPGLGGYLGGLGAVSKLAVDPIPFDDESDGALVAAGLTACLGASHLFKAAHAMPTGPATICAWHLCDGDCGGAPSTIGRLDVGDVAIIGAGAVGGALGYWAREFHPIGQWTFVDRDVVSLHNTNRGLLHFPVDTDWWGRTPRSKAVGAAERTGMQYFMGWYDEWSAQTPSPRPDLVIPVANERAVRAACGQRGEPLLLHATTSSSWEAQLHRHRGRRDDCITCRMTPAELAATTFACSEGRVPTPRGDSADAALPFLSGAAGHLLMVALLRLQHGQLEGDRNLWRLNLLSPGRRFFSGRSRCRDGCQTALPERALNVLNRGRRWVG